MISRDWTPYPVQGTLKQSAAIVCEQPSCRSAIILVDYAISDNGTVSRRVVCPKCGRNQGYIQLAGWDGTHKRGSYDIDLTG